MPERKPILLVVDDEPDQREFVKNYFSRRGLIVLTTATGEEAPAANRSNMEMGAPVVPPGIPPPRLTACSSGATPKHRHPLTRNV